MKGGVAGLLALPFVLLGLAGAGNLAVSYVSDASPLSAVLGDQAPRFVTENANNGFPLQAAISPDGTKVALQVSVREGQGTAIYVGGKGALHLLVGAAEDTGTPPVWVGNDALLYTKPVAWNAPSQPICKIDLASKRSSCFRSTHGYVMSYLPSPDGRTIAYLAGKGTVVHGATVYQLWLRDWKTGSERHLPTVGVSLGLNAGMSWSADGTKIVYAESNGTREQVKTVAIADTSPQPETVLTLPARTLITGFGPWVGDRVSLLLLRNNPLSRTELIELNLRTRSLRSLYRIAGSVASASWSADGRTVLLSDLLTRDLDREGVLVRDGVPTVIPGIERGSVSASGKERVWISSSAAAGQWDNVAVTYLGPDGSAYRYALPRMHVLLDSSDHYSQHIVPAFFAPNDLHSH